ncbi:hypothetical protein CGCSCA1_v000188 [Colletotrichum siamense]|nr:hypothetical protein CGCSCA1_v000188 [Colletotrichum siamense]
MQMTTNGVSVSMLHSMAKRIKLARDCVLRILGPHHCIQTVSPDWFIDAGYGDACAFGAVIIGRLSWADTWALLTLGG